MSDFEKFDSGDLGYGNTEWQESAISMNDDQLQRVSLLEENYVEEDLILFAAQQAARLESILRDLLVKLPNYPKDQYSINTEAEMRVITKIDEIQQLLVDRYKSEEPTRHERAIMIVALESLMESHPIAIFDQCPLPANDRNKSESWYGQLYTLGASENTEFRDALLFTPSKTTNVNQRHLRPSQDQVITHREIFPPRIHEILQSDRLGNTRFSNCMPEDGTWH